MNYSYTQISQYPDLPAAPPQFPGNRDHPGISAARPWGGGGHNDGIVFKLTPGGQGSRTESKPYVFPGGAGGSGPQPNLLFGLFGRIYGMTESGGDKSKCGGYGCGVVFELQQP